MCTGAHDRRNICVLEHTIEGILCVLEHTIEGILCVLDHTIEGIYVYRSTQ